MSVRRLPLLLVIALFADPASATVAVFNNAPTIRMDGFATGIQAADFDHDLKLDFAVVTTHDTQTMRLSVYLGNGDGSFRDPVVNSFTYPAVSAPRLEVADLDGNDLPDAVVSFYGVTAVYPLLGKGNGSFDAMPAVQQSANCSAYAFALGDMTNDGRVDIVTCGISVFPSLGGGTFGSAITSAAPFGGVLRVLDINGDGKLDVFAARSGRSALLHGNGDGTLQLDTSFPETSTTTVAVADFDGNGRDDLTFIDDRTIDRVLMLASAASQAPERVSMGSVAPMLDAGMITPDMNGDARPDLVAAWGSHVFVWLTGPDGRSLAPAIYIPGNMARNVIAGDFDSDGKIDLLVHGPGETRNYDSSYVTLLRGIGNGALSGERGYALPSHRFGVVNEPSFVDHMAVSDITGDGKLDLVAGSKWHLSVFPGQGDGSFGQQITTVTSADYWTTVIPRAFGDLNEDGVIDVIAASGSTDQLWLGSRAGTFQRASGIPIPGGSTDIEIGDFNGDGKLDLARVTIAMVQFYPGHGDGTFGEPVVTPLGLNDLRFRHRLADINRDGRDDIVTGRAVLLGLATGGFQTLVYSQSHFDDFDPVAADLDGDGNSDLVLFEKAWSWGSVRVLIGRGDGTFSAVEPLSLWINGAYAPPLAADFDGDGDLDVSFSSSILLGDGKGWFDGYARFRLPVEKAFALAADLDHNGSSDLILACFDKQSLYEPGSQTIDVIRTRTTTSRELPISFAYSFGSVNAPAVGGWFQAVYAEGFATSFHPGGGGLLFYFGNKLTGIGDLTDEGVYGDLEALRVGPQPHSAVYSGDEVYARTSAFPGGTIQVKRAQVTMTASLNPPAPRADEPLHVYGTVGRTVYDVPPKGKVTVVVDKILVGVATAPFYDVVAGPLAAGRHTVLVEFLGDESYLYTSQAFEFSAAPGKVNMRFSVSPAGAAAAAAPVTLTATFPNDPALAGDVEFFAGAQSLGQKPVSGGAASVTTTLPVGHYTFRATFSGNGQYVETSESLPYTITPGPPRRRASGKP